MIEECVVSSVKRGVAYIALASADKCEGCKACAFGANKSKTIPALIDGGVGSCKKGDMVKVKLPEKEIKAVYLIAYVLPILSLFIGLLIGQLFDNGLIQLACILTLFALSFVAIYFIGKLFRNQKYMPIVIEIITI